MPVIDQIASLVGGNLADGVAKIISLFKVDPNVALQNQTELQKIQLEMQNKIIDQTTVAITSAGEIIKAEAQSQSWLPRNVRPLLMLVWGATISFNALIPMIAQFWIPSLKPFPLDPWVYKMTMVCVMGYVGARTVEKTMDKDN